MRAGLGMAMATEGEISIGMPMLHDARYSTKGEFHGRVWYSNMEQSTRCSTKAPPSVNTEKAHTCGDT